MFFGIKSLRIVADFFCQILLGAGVEKKVFSGRAVLFQLYTAVPILTVAQPSSSALSNNLSYVLITFSFR